MHLNQYTKSVAADFAEPATLAETQGGFSCARVGIILQHWGVATALAKEYRNIPRLEFEDILQHARIGLVKAAMRYDAQRGAAFSTYAWRVIQNDLNTLYVKQQRRIHWEAPCLENSRALEEENESPENAMCDDSADVRAHVRRRENQNAIHKAIAKLPDRQRRVIHGVLAGQDYRDIGKQLGFSDISAKTLVARAYQNSLKNLRLELEKQGFCQED
ncbi:MAG: sigma-70 family RNA polymerase sigma factor [bacterium]